MLLLRVAFDPILGSSSPFLLSVLAVAVSAWRGGLGPGLFATALAAAGTTYFVLRPAYSFALPTALEQLQLALFVTIGAVVSGLAASLLRARDRTSAAERAADEDREWLRVTLRSVGDGVIATDERGHVRFINPAAERLTGVPAAEAIGQPLAAVFRILAEDTRAPAEDPVATVLREGLVVGLANHTLLVARDGTERPISDSGAPIEDDAGQIRGVVLVFLDDSERRRQERERDRLLREVEAERAHLADVLQHAPSFMCILRGPDHVYERQNALHARLVGDRDIIGRPIREALPEVAAQGLGEILDRVYRTGEPFAASGMPVLLQRRPGEPPEQRMLDFVYQPLRDPDGAVTGILVQGVDLTERVRAEAALRESEERLRLMVESVQDYGIFMLDPEGRISSWNAGAERIKGYTAAEIIGEHFSIFYTDDDRRSGHPAEVLRRALAGGSVAEEGWRLRKDGSQFWASSVVAAIRDAAGRHLGFVKVTRDLTERRRAEERLQRLNEELEGRVRERTAALEAINKELEAFSYSVSHDLRAPLRGIDGFAKILLQQYGPSFDDKGRHYLERIRAGTQRMGRLIDDLLRLSRISRAEIRRVPVDLGALARAVAEELRGAAPGRSVELVITEPIPVVGDPQLLRVVLENLLGNAWKFTSRTAHARIELGEVAHGGERAFYVRDNGAGFDMEYADKLFGAFQRLHDASEFEGTGIGLATVQRVIARHGGRVWAEGRVDEGATFWFTLGEGVRS